MVCNSKAIRLASVVAVLAFYLQGCGEKKKVEVPKAECEGGVPAGANCMDVGCCEEKGFTCYKKDDTWASCAQSCKPGKHDDDPKEFRTPWNCSVVTPPAPAPPPPKGWVVGTYVTGYWDCCKPSCSWAGKGKVKKPVMSCDVGTGKALEDINEKSVCEGGKAATCANQIPFMVNDGLSMGFAAAGVGETSNGINGDANCGQCFELKFTNQQHKNKDGTKWGGASDDLVDKRMIVQVTNIGKDVTGNHTFDIMIPGAGMGIFTDGCKKQFPGHEATDFDCGTHYGGCAKKEDCDKLPEHLQAGCKWRYDWFRYNKDGKTNNPYIRFQRVACPHQLVAISGAKPLDDGEYMAVI